ncbi:MAG: T9SS C-terminal target domain-containing protein, partial [Calditrichaeota bacterium]
LPDTYMLTQNYPNPFNPSTTIEYSLPVRSDVTIEILNILGQRVKRLVDKEQAAGNYQVVWDSRNDSGQRVATGIYFYRLTADGFTKTKKMLLLR